VEKNTRKRLRRYGVAILVTAAAVMVRLAIDPILGDRFPFCTFFGAVAITVWYSGYRPAILAMVLCYLAADYLFVEPRGALGPGSARDVIGLLADLLSCAVIITIGQTMHVALRRAEARRQQLEEAEVALRRTMEQLQIVTESMAAPVTRCGRDLKYRWVSKPYADWIGRPPEEIIGRPIVEVLGLAAFEQLLPRFEQVLAGKRVHYEEEVNFRGLGLRWTSGIYTPTFNQAGVPDGWVAVVLDLTERMRLEAELRQRVEQLADADRRKDEFLATLAHELRNPLAPIRHAVELQRRAAGDSALMEKARSMMERQLAQMVRLIDDLLDISRITRGKLRLRKERVELAAVIRSGIEAARPLIDAQGHQLTVTLPPEPIHLDADSLRLAQVFSNLLNNAAKYTEKGGRIWLTAERQRSEVVVSVRDTGIGIATEHLSHIFEMFSQVAPALERSQGGLGIGLALVRGLVELHGGNVEARSAGLGKGSEFLVRLAVVATAAPPRAETGGDGEKFTAAARLRILVVDDNRDAADSLAIMLRLAGHEVEMANDGLEAVQAAGAFRPDVVLLDIGLPRMNGYEAARHIREQPWGKDMPLIALTGWGQEEDKRRAQEAGFDHHLTKPVEAEAIQKVLAVFAGARSRAAENHRDGTTRPSS
jgi:PAS domain S-box-containing protein